jgi:hypothetical protein
MSLYTEALGKRGASRQSWQANNPREALRRIVANYPRAGEAELFKKWWDAVHGEPEMMRVVGQYWFVNNLGSLQRATGEIPPPKPSARAKKAAATRQAVAEESLRRIVARKAGVILLDTVLPNGKKLRTCTGAECIEFGPIVGGWLEAVGGRVGRTNVVGKTLNEDAVRSIFDEVAARAC